MIPRKRSFARHLIGWAVSLVGAGLAAAVPAAAQSVSPSEAPAAWVAYAQSVTASITALLQGDSEQAVRLRASLGATRPTPDQPATPLMLKVWMDGEGTVTKVEFASSPDSEANADLRELIVGQKLAAAPPRDMLLPLRIAVELDAPSSQMVGPSM